MLSTTPPAKIHLYADSRYVANALQRFIGGTPPQGKRQDLWNLIWSARAKLAQVTWMKAHLTEDQAATRGISRTAWALNRLADQQATLGVGSHTEDPSAWALYELQALHIRESQQHLIKVYTKVR